MSSGESDIERVRAVAGDAVLGVVRYDEDEYEVLDVGDAERYPSDRLEEIARELSLETIAVTYAERELYDLGCRDATVHRFEEGAVIHVRRGEAAGVGVCLDDESLAGDVLDALREGSGTQ